MSVTTVANTYDIAVDGKYREWREDDSTTAKAREAAMWIGDRVRNWKRSREGGEFSDIKGLCWMFGVEQFVTDGPVRIRVYIEFGQLAPVIVPLHLEDLGVLTEEVEESPDTAAIFEALKGLMSLESGLNYEIERMWKHPDCLAFNVTANADNRDALWTEMLRITKVAIANPLLVSVHQWIG